MRAPMPERVERDIKHEMTGYIATTKPGHCYVCLTDVGGDPSFTEELPDLDATLSVWLCEGCWHESISPDEGGWNDAANNV